MAEVKKEIGELDSPGDEEEVRLGKKWLWSLVMAISLARIGSGLFVSIHGPSLLSLADITGSTVNQVSWVFTTRSIGVLLGSILTGWIMRKTNNIYSFAVASFLLGAVGIATPWMTSLAALAAVVMVGGITFGYLDAGMQALILQVWGEKDSRPHINAYHFTIALGAFLAPIITGPFLQQENSTDSSDICPATNEFVNTTEIPITTTAPYNGINPVVWAYFICGFFMVTVAMVFIVLGYLDLETKVRMARQIRGEVVEQRPEDPVRFVWLFFVFVCGYYFFCVAAETAYQSYIYSVAVCSDLQFEPLLASWLNAVYWAGFGAGRAGGIFVSQYLEPNTMIIADFCGTLATMAVQSIFGEGSAAVTWAITFLYAFFQATLYPAGVSWTSKYTNMSGNYIFMYSCGQALGQIVLLPLGGYLFQLNPWFVMYMITASAVCNAVFYGLMVIERRFNQPKLEEYREKRHGGKTSQVVWATEL